MSAEATERLSVSEIKSLELNKRMGSKKSMFKENIYIILTASTIYATASIVAKLIDALFQSYFSICQFY